MAKKFQTFEESLLLLQQEAQNAPISFGEILRILPGRSQSLVLILLSLPFCQPLQIPGLSVPFGLTIAFLGLRRVFGKRLWLPKKVLEHSVKASTLQKILNAALVLVRKMKRWIHPRLSGLCNAPVMHVINGLSISLAGIFLSVPLPVPFTNLAAAWAIFLIALGTLEDDGLFVLIGYGVLLMTVAFFVGIALSINHVL